MPQETPSPARISASMEQLRLDYAERFPRWTQQLVTIFSGKAAPGQRAPRWITPPLVNWFLTLVQLAAAVLAGVYAVPGSSTTTQKGRGDMPITWLVTVNAVRKLQVTWSHHAVHKEVSGNKHVDKVVQVVSSAVSLTSNYEDIFEDHIRSHHNRKVFTTIKDPDAGFLMYLGFRPGMPMERVCAGPSTGPRSPHGCTCRSSPSASAPTSSPPPGPGGSPPPSGWASSS